MEEYDDLVQRPDEDGLLDLSHRAWVTLDEALWEFTKTLLYLNCSYNNIQVLSPGIGELVMLKELDMSCNQLQSLPAELGKCTRMRKLKVNGNQLKTLPPEIGDCKMLEEIQASENGMQELPVEIGKLDQLVTLLLQNNDLKELPPELGECFSLENLDCSLNSELDMIPQKLRTDAAICKWICRQARGQRTRIDDLEEITAEMEELARLNDEEKIKLRDQIHVLEERVDGLEKERPEAYLKFKARALQARSVVCTIS